MTKFLYRLPSKKRSLEFKDSKHPIFSLEYKIKSQIFSRETSFTIYDEILEKSLKMYEKFQVFWETSKEKSFYWETSKKRIDQISPSK